MPDSSAQASPRRIRSFVRRAGRLTTGQKRALETLWPRWGVAAPAQALNPDQLFGRRAPAVVEIGFGDGEVLVATGQTHPEWNCLGIEVHEPGVGHCLLGIEAANLTNLRLAREDAIEVLREWLAPGSLDRVHLFFPDPWPKKRHHKRRIVQPDFVQLVASRLKAGGIFRMATDWAPYADHIRQVMAGSAAFTPARDDFVRPPTKFEARGQRLGHAIMDSAYQRA